MLSGLEGDVARWAASEKCWCSVSVGLCYAAAGLDWAGDVENVYKGDGQALLVLDMIDIL